MTRKLTLILTVAVFATPAIAQMGGGMNMGGPITSDATSYDPMKMSKGEEKSWAACQAMSADDMAKNKKCVRLKAKKDRIAAAQAK